jgi:hypothetical protein
LSAVALSKLNAALTQNHEPVRIEVTLTIGLETREVGGQLLDDWQIDQKVENGFGVVQAEDVTLRVLDTDRTLEDWIRSSVDGLVTVAVRVGYMGTQELEPVENQFWGRVRVAELQRDADGALCIYCQSDVNRLGNVGASNVWGVPDWTGQHGVQQVMEAYRRYIGGTTHSGRVLVKPWESTTGNLNFWADQPENDYHQGQDITYLGGDSDYRYFVLCGFGQATVAEGGIYTARMDRKTWAVDFHKVARLTVHPTFVTHLRLFRLSSAFHVVAEKQAGTGVVQRMWCLDFTAGWMLPECRQYDVNTGAISPEWKGLAALDGGDVLMTYRAYAGSSDVVLYVWTRAQLWAGALPYVRTVPTGTFEGAPFGAVNLVTNWFGAVVGQYGGSYYYALACQRVSSSLYYASVWIAAVATPTVWAWKYAVQCSSGYLAAEPCSVADQYVAFVGQPLVLDVPHLVFLDPSLPGITLNLQSVKRNLTGDLCGVNLDGTDYKLLWFARPGQGGYVVTTDMGAANVGKYDLYEFWDYWRNGANFSGRGYLGAVTVNDPVSGVPSDLALRWVSNKHVPMIEFGTGLTTQTVRNVLTACCRAALGLFRFTSEKGFDFIGRAAYAGQTPNPIGDWLIAQGIEVDGSPEYRVKVSNDTSSATEPPPAAVEPQERFDVTDSLLPTSGLQATAEGIYDWLQQRDYNDNPRQMQVIRLRLDSDPRWQVGDMIEHNVVTIDATGRLAEHVKAVVTGLRLVGRLGGGVVTELVTFRRYDP